MYLIKRYRFYILHSYLIQYILLHASINSLLSHKRREYFTNIILFHNILKIFDTQHPSFDIYQTIFNYIFGVYNRCTEFDLFFLLIY